jgi:hypothetical protein
MQEKSVSRSSLLSRRASGTLVLFLHPEAPARVSQRALTFADRVTYERAIEEVYWHHRIWPKERPDPKPPLDQTNQTPRKQLK